MDGNGVVEWLQSLPVITKWYFAAILVTSILCQLDYVSPLHLYFNYRLVFYKYQFWRLVTPFLYFGSLNFDFLFHMFFLLRYCRVLEDESFRNRPADFLYMLIIGGSFMLLVGPIVKATFLSTALTFMIVYIWSRRNPAVVMNFLGIFTFTAPFMPWVLLSFSLIISGKLPASDLLGIASGHLYYYFSDVYPVLYGTRPLATPALLKYLFESDRGYGTVTTEDGDN